MVDNEGIIVMCPKNIHVFSDYDSDVDVAYGRPQKLQARQLKSLGIRSALYDGRLRVKEGTVSFMLKDATVKVIGLPEGNTTVTVIGVDGTWIKDLEAKEVVKVAPAKLPEPVKHAPKKHPGMRKK